MAECPFGGRDGVAQTTGNIKVRVRYFDPNIEEEFDSFTGSDAFRGMAIWLLTHYATRKYSLSKHFDDAEVKLCRVHGEIHAEVRSTAVSLEINGVEINYQEPTASDAWLPITDGWMRGRSLPFVVLHEPEKFYCACLSGKWTHELSAQAVEVAYRASRIRIPRPVNCGWLVTHSIDMEGSYEGCYEGFRFTRRILPPSFTRYFIDEAWLNLFRCCEDRETEEGGSENMSNSFFREFGSDGERWSQARCERFFSDKKNFISDEFEATHAIL
jgi:hypothetical protein